MLRLNVETGGVGRMNLNSILAGFFGGLICGSIVFICSRSILLHKLIKRERLRDLSYFGRNTRDKAISRPK